MHLKKINNIDLKLDLSYVLKNIIKESQYTIPIFIPHLGCRNECVFCNQRKISGNIKQEPVENVENIIEKYLEYFKHVENKKIEIAFFGGSFTGININRQIQYLEAANKYIKSGKVNSIRISTRPDYISVDILKLMKKYNVRTIELGVQSLDNNVLLASKRGHQKKEVVRASKLIKFFEINLGHQIMLGLPESTPQTELYTIDEVLKLSPSDLRIYPVYIIEPSELYDMYIDGRYNPLTLDEAIIRTYNIIKRCQKTDIKIIRIGLQSTEIITSKNDTVIGPVCDNFGEYVIAKVVREKIEDEINGIKLVYNDEGYNRINIITEKRYASFIIGPKKINRLYFKEKYNVDLKIKYVD